MARCNREKLRKLTAAAIGLACAAVSSHAGAGVSEDLKHCAAVRSSRERLACYDAVARIQRPAPTGIKVFSDKTDIQLPDKDNYNFNTGALQNHGGYSMLGSLQVKGLGFFGDGTADGGYKGAVGLNFNSAPCCTASAGGFLDFDYGPSIQTHVIGNTSALLHSAWDMTPMWKSNSGHWRFYSTVYGADAFTVRADGVDNTFALNKMLALSVPAGIIATANNDRAAGGVVGEYISAKVESGSAIPLTSGAPAHVATIELPSGDWNICGNVAFTSEGSRYSGWIQTSSSTEPAAIDEAAFAEFSDARAFPVGCRPMNLAGKTNVSLGAQANFSNSMKAYGFIWARRAR